MQLPPDLPISAEDWGQTPPAVQAVVTALWAENQELRARVAALEVEVAKLREQVGKNSRLSSKPPSSDPPSVPPKQKAPTGRKPGGQPGHEGHGRPLEHPDQAHHVVDVKETLCAHCGALLLGDDPHPQRHQVTELPRIEPVVTEYRRHTLKCLACGELTEAAWPQGMPSGDFGPGMAAAVGYVTGRLNVSQRDAQEVVGTLAHAQISLGSVKALQRRVSAALAEPVAEAEEYVRQQPVANVDETPWQEKRRRLWAWTAVAALATVFRALAGRGTAQFRELLGETFAGKVGSGRLAAYNCIETGQRQACWPHLIRDFAAFTCRGGDSLRLGDALLSQAERMFQLWHRVRDGTLERSAFQEEMQPIQAGVGELLREGAKLDHAATRNTCGNLLKLEAALWAFVRVPGVEPTNNSAWRALRRLVLRSRVGRGRAAAQLRHAQRRGEPLRRADDDGGGHLAPAGPRRPGLPDGGVCRRRQG